MSATADPSTATADPHGTAGHGHGHDDHHEPFLAHHFESWQQQFDAGKLGVWAFLVQEVLFFSGLFCAYAVYRMLHPEVFEYADQFLSVPHGAFNTVVLLFSSLTMAWGVRCAMLGQRNGLIGCLAVTLFCAALFLGVKAYEYSEKYHAQLIWAGADPLTVSPSGMQAGAGHLLELDPEKRAVGEQLEERLASTLHYLEFGMGVVGLLTLAAAVGIYYAKPERIGLAVVFGAISLSAIAIVIGAMASMGIHHMMHASGHEATADSEAEAAHMAEAEDEPPVHTATPGTAEIAGSTHGASVKAELSRPQRLGTFFGIYYAMTGVHALHILGGMVVLTWLLARAVKGHFTPNYFGPVDYVGLYWHLVDLVWIYLFPLLYLIG
ncbi:MAG: cytochrome c oxidase subunit 3 [Planctomycetota bacterium]|nr:cytochrome c oxidase subunit 3 [Planctomycetaceae bacterium]MDQ3330059.1 cytochrome c oxidase subunit 3 [Planctomycetota bacterium]